MSLTQQEEARGQPKKVIFWLLVRGLFAKRRGRPAGQAGGDHPTGRQSGATDQPSSAPPRTAPASPHTRRADTPPIDLIDSTDRQREREMASDDSARRAIRLSWHRTAQCAVLIAVVLVLSHWLLLPVLTVAPIAVGGLISYGGGVGLFTVLSRWRQAGGQGDENGPSSSDAEPSS